MDVQASTAKTLSKAALQHPFEIPVMSGWIAIEWIRGAESSWIARLLTAMMPLQAKLLGKTRRGTWWGYVQSVVHC
jgi:hypothetical protein